MAGKEPWYVLDEAERRREGFRDADIFVEEAGAGAAEARSLPGDGEILAGEAPGEEVNTAMADVPHVGESFAMPRPLAPVCPNRTDITESFDIRPSPPEHPLAEGLVFDLGDDVESGPFESKVEASHPAEE